MSDADTVRSAFRWFGVAAALSAVLALLIHYLEFKGVLASAEATAVDHYLTLATTSVQNPRIVTVSIDDKDFADLFDDKSPLDPATLMTLISAIQNAGAAVVGVDILTDSGDYSDTTYARRGALSEALSKIQIRSSEVPVVWAAAVEGAELRRGTFFSWLNDTPDLLLATPGKVLGQSVTAPTAATDLRWGAPLFPTDDDRAIRRLPRTWRDPRGERHLSLAAAVAKAYCNSPRPCFSRPQDPEEIYISYGSTASIQPDFYLRELFDCVPDENGLCRSFVPHVPRNPEIRRLQGAIVLLGGTFATSNDFHQTSAEHRTPGLILNAHAVVADIRGPYVTEPGRRLTLVLDFGLGLILALVFSPLATRLVTEGVGWRVMASFGLAGTVARLAVPLFLSAGILWVSWVGMFLVGISWHVLLETRHMRMHVPEHEHV